MVPHEPLSQFYNFLLPIALLDVDDVHIPSLWYCYYELYVVVLLSFLFRPFDAVLIENLLGYIRSQDNVIVFNPSLNSHE